METEILKHFIPMWIERSVQRMIPESFGNGKYVWRVYCKRDYSGWIVNHSGVKTREVDLPYNWELV